MTVEDATFSKTMTVVDHGKCVDVEMGQDGKKERDAEQNSEIENGPVHAEPELRIVVAEPEIGTELPFTDELHVSDDQASDDPTTQTTTPRTQNNGVNESSSHGLTTPTSCPSVFHFPEETRLTGSGTHVQGSSTFDSYSHNFSFMTNNWSVTQGHSATPSLKFEPLHRSLVWQWREKSFRIGIFSRCAEFIL